MTDPEDFLSRWSRRKREAKAEDPPQRDDEALSANAADEERETTSAKAQDTLARSESGESASADVFDLSKLPSLDSIGPATDIRMFLQPGVPGALSRAALRRAWSADPAIRDFIGLSENSWDFTASDSMHGFGALDPADAKRMLAQLFSESERKPENETQDALTDNALGDAEARQGEALAPDSSSNADGEAIPDATVPQTGGDTLQADNEATDTIASQHPIVSVAPQQKTTEPLREPAFAPRSHGRALPQ
jgi:hypothetical protein